MKALFTTLLITFTFFVHGQAQKTLPFGKNTLTGTVMLKTLIHPITEKPIKDAIVLKLPYKVKFTATDELADDVITDEIRIYGDVQKVKDPNTVYKALINKQVEIKANIVYAPSGNYPLLANIIEDFSYTIIK